MLFGLVLTAAEAEEWESRADWSLGELAWFEQADAGTRTPDPLLTMEVLYQLSYVGGEVLHGTAPCVNRPFLGPHAVHLDEAIGAPFFERST